MSGAGRSWQYIGGKTLMFPDVAELEKQDATKGFTQTEDYLRRIMAILEELNRRQYEQDKTLTEVVTSSQLYLGTMTTTNAMGTGWYNCTMEKFTVAGAKESLDDNGVVLNLVDDKSGVEGLVAGNEIACWKISEEDADTDLYVGVELYGRTIVGKCV